MDIYEKQELEKASQDFNFEKSLNEDRQQSINSRNSSKKGIENLNLKILSPRGSLTAFREIDLGEDWGHFVIIAFSIIADIISLVPFLGAIMALFFSCIFFVIYFLSGQLKNRAVAKVVISSSAYFMEFIGGFFLLGVLPIFTLSAIIIYWLELSYKQQNKEKNNA